MMFRVRRAANSAIRLFLFGAAMALAAPARAQSGSETAALLEMANLETALEIANLDTNYYVSLESLNDLLDPTTPAYNGINNGGGAYVIDTQTGLFRSTRLVMNGATWLGPYVAFQAGRTQIGTMPYDEGSPLDPWGRPYLFFSPMGLLRGDSGAVTQEFYADQFDRWTIVTLGLDGIESGDDLMRQFGGGVSRLGISSIAGAGVTMLHTAAGTEFTAPHASQVAIRGYLFGAAQGGSQVFLGTDDVSSSVAAWSASLITLDLPEGFAGTEQIYLKVGASESNRLTLTVLPNAAEGWERYE